MSDSQEQEQPEQNTNRQASIDPGTAPMPDSSLPQPAGTRDEGSHDASGARRDDAQREVAPARGKAPEEPHKAGYANVDGHYHKPNKLTYKNVSFRADDRETAEFNSARSLSTLATVIGVFSVFFGGVVLSVIGLVAGIFAWRKMSRIANCHPEDPRVHKALRHAGITPVVVCAVALALNALMLALMYPMFQQLVDSGQISNIMQMPNSGFNPGGNPYDFGQGAGSGSSTWG